jgi:hypothetical protein
MRYRELPIVLGRPLPGSGLFRGRVFVPLIKISGNVETWKNNIAEAERNGQIINYLAATPYKLCNELVDITYYIWAEIEPNERNQNI